MKSYTANQINKASARPGRTVWQRESFDRFVRGEKDLDRILDYIKNNPENITKGRYTLYIDPRL